MEPRDLQLYIQNFYAGGYAGGYDTSGNNGYSTGFNSDYANSDAFYNQFFDNDYGTGMSSLQARQNELFEMYFGNNYQPNTNTNTNTNTTNNSTTNTGNTGYSTLAQAEIDRLKAENAKLKEQYNTDTATLDEQIEGLTQRILDSDNLAEIEKLQAEIKALKGQVTNGTVQEERPEIKGHYNNLNELYDAIDKKGNGISKSDIQRAIMDFEDLGISTVTVGEGDNAEEYNLVTKLGNKWGKAKGTDGKDLILATDVNKVKLKGGDDIAFVADVKRNFWEKLATVFIGGKAQVDGTGNNAVITGQNSMVDKIKLKDGDNGVKVNGDTKKVKLKNNAFSSLFIGGNAKKVKLGDGDSYTNVEGSVRKIKGQGGFDIVDARAAKRINLGKQDIFSTENTERLEYLIGTPVVEEQVNDSTKAAVTDAEMEEIQKELQELVKAEDTKIIVGNAGIPEDFTGMNIFVLNDNNVIDKYENGTIVKRTIKNRDGKTTEIAKYEYDETTNIKTETYYKADGETVKEVKKFDKDGQLI